jgi:serine/threonine protein kinase
MVCLLLALCLPAAGVSTDTPITTVGAPRNWKELRDLIESAPKVNITELVVTESFNFSDYDFGVSLPCSVHVIIRAEGQVTWDIAPDMHCESKEGEYACSFFQVNARAHLELRGALTLKRAKNVALSVKSQGYLQMNGTTVKDCHTPKGGAAIFADGTGSDGTGSVVETFNVTFLNNTAMNNGGAVMLTAYAKGSFEQSYFGSNVCMNEGGAIFAGQHSRLNLTDTRVESNCGYMGSGAVLLEQGSSATILRSYFLKNRAGHTNAGAKGGAITLFGGAYALIDSSDFANNTAEEGAAFRLASGTHVTFIRPSFSENMMEGHVSNSLAVEKSARVSFISGKESPSIRGSGDNCTSGTAHKFFNLGNCASASDCCGKLRAATSVTPGAPVTLKSVPLSQLAIGIAAFLCVALLILSVHYYRRDTAARHHSDLQASDLLGPQPDLTEPIFNRTSLNSDVVVTVQAHQPVHTRSRTAEIMSAVGLVAGKGNDRSKQRTPPNKLPGQIDYKCIKWAKQKDGSLAVLGEGAYGVVYEGSFEGRPAAIKRIRLPRRPTSHLNSTGDSSDSSSGDVQDIHRKLQALRTEIELLWELRHPNILLTYGVAFVRERQEESVCLVSEQCRGSLDVYIRRGKQQQQPLSQQGTANRSNYSSWSSSAEGVSNCDMSMPVLTADMLVRLMEETAAGLAFMHERRVIHRDLKPHNIFIARDGSARIGDFGLSRMLNHHKRESQSLTQCNHTLTMQQSLTANIGSPAYMAPELMSVPEDALMPDIRLTADLDDDTDSTGTDGVNRAKYGAAIDVYAFGIMLNCLWRRCSPYDERRYHGAMHLLRCVEEGHRPQDPATKLGCPAFYIDVMHKCWAPKPSDRISAEEAFVLLRSRGSTPSRCSAVAPRCAEARILLG